ncbi:MAG: alanine--tRNA ligase [Planctomycetota bacterium]|jgi:alanyl-tRNA synthetase|nr:alanine--tRNA ligase [Planctomycetota bacterium]
MKTNLVRARYLDFFASKGARVVPSDSLVPSNDPTLLFTGAGMNQFKDQFMGIRIEYRSATSCQKCIRTGDIMNVGVTPSHHTMFEMLGNFSFGGYFKQEAINWAWEFLTREIGIDPDRLQVSVHTSDDEAYALWQRDIGLAPARISRLGDHDNFWPADAPKLGPNGPCGPCSEIFFDRGAEYGCGRPDCGITCDCRRWVEIWNLVFTQYNRHPDGSLVPLPQKNIDTGMGLERMAACLQGAKTNMDIDIFQPLVAMVAKLSSRVYGERREDDVLMRRIADHARAVTFCIADGVLPANSHRGYVLKRLLRRAVLDGRNLGIRGDFLHRLVPLVGEAMAEPYPEVLAQAAGIEETVRLEEEKFLSTIDRGLALIDRAVTEAKQDRRDIIPGAAAFELHDTYGFPYELAEEVVARHGMSIDRPGFDAALDQAREKAREGAKMRGEVFVGGPLKEIKKLSAGTKFLGYDCEAASGKVLAVVKGEHLVDKALPGDPVTLVLDETPFYGESGGQVGDTGLIVGPGNLVVRVEDVQKVDGIHLHLGVVESGEVSPGLQVEARVDASRRLDIRRNHTTAHLLHHALRRVVGDRAEQKGSYVAPDRLRFDFQHGAALTKAELATVEELVNQSILANAPVVTRELPLEEAKKSGAIALFGEKYGATVRVVSVGDFSVEFCGGTHMDATAPIGAFRILGEEAVAAGVRRLEGVTGLAAFRHSREQGERLDAIARELKVPAREAGERLGVMTARLRELEKNLLQLKTAQARQRLSQVKTQTVAGASLLAADVGEIGGKELGDLAREALRGLGDLGVVVLASQDNGKAALAVAVGKGLASGRAKAGDLVKKLATHIGGGGGGRADFAQAGGKNTEKLPELLAATPTTLADLLANPASK